MTLRERFEQLEPREQRLLGVLVLVFAVMLVLLVPILLFAMVSSRASENEHLREAIEQIHASRDRIQSREADKRRLDQRYQQVAPPLAGYLDKLANEVGMEIPESQDRAVVPHGKKFDERSTKLVLKKVGMLTLVNFMEKVENSGYPLRVSSFNLRKRGTEEDSYDVNLIVSAFDRKETKPAPAEDVAGERPPEVEE
jgi:hypothetical protein